MLSLPSHARVTLALDIVRKLDSGPWRGYHELAIIKHQIDLHDTIGVEPWPEMAIVCSTPGVPVDRTNVCWRAAEELARSRGMHPRVRITIDKRLPVQGGLAGGSSNAATTLLLLNRLWDLRLSLSDLVPVARSVGMDVPYFLSGGTAFDTEATGELRAIPTSLSLDFVVALPDFGVSTREAYGAIDYTRIGARRGHTAAMERALIAGDRASLIEAMHNDFEITVFAAHPALSALRDELRAAGCLAAGMSGSGSTIIGIARDRHHAERVAGSLRCRCVVASSLQHH